MRYDCGPTWQEKLRSWSNWHLWFAWHPVRITGTRQCVWLETVERQGMSDYVGVYYSYRLPETQLGCPPKGDGNK